MVMNMLPAVAAEMDTLWSIPYSDGRQYGYTGAALLTGDRQHFIVRGLGVHHALRAVDRPFEVIASYHVEIGQASATDGNTYVVGCMPDGDLLMNVGEREHGLIRWRESERRIVWKNDSILLAQYDARSNVLQGRTATAEWSIDPETGKPITMITATGSQGVMISPGSALATFVDDKRRTVAVNLKTGERMVLPAGTGSFFMAEPGDSTVLRLYGPGLVRLHLGRMVITDTIHGQGMDLDYNLTSSVLHDNGRFIATTTRNGVALYEIVGDSLRYRRTGGTMYRGDVLAVQWLDDERFLLNTQYGTEIRHLDRYADDRQPVTIALAGTFPGAMVPSPDGTYLFSTSDLEYSFDPTTATMTNRVPAQSIPFSPYVRTKGDSPTGSRRYCTSRFIGGSEDRCYDTPEDMFFIAASTDGRYGVLEDMEGLWVVDFDDTARRLWIPYDDDGDGEGFGETDVCFADGNRTMVMMVNANEIRRYDLATFQMTIPITTDQRFMRPPGGEAPDPGRISAHWPFASPASSDIILSDGGRTAISVMSAITGEVTGTKDFAPTQVSSASFGEDNSILVTFWPTAGVGDSASFVILDRSLNVMYEGSMSGQYVATLQPFWDSRTGRLTTVESNAIVVRTASGSTSVRADDHSHLRPDARAIVSTTFDVVLPIAPGSIRVFDVLGRDVTATMRISAAAAGAHVEGPSTGTGLYHVIDIVTSMVVGTVLVVP